MIPATQLTPAFDAPTHASIDAALATLSSRAVLVPSPTRASRHAPEGRMFRAWTYAGGDRDIARAILGGVAHRAHTCHRVPAHQCDGCELEATRTRLLLRRVARLARRLFVGIAPNVEVDFAARYHAIATRRYGSAMQDLREFERAGTTCDCDVYADDGDRCSLCLHTREVDDCASDVNRAGEALGAAILTWLGRAPMPRVEVAS